MYFTIYKYYFLILYELQGDPEIVRLLLEYGARVNVKVSPLFII